MSKAKQLHKEMIEGTLLLLEGSELCEYFKEAIDEKFGVLCPDEPTELDEAGALYFSVFGLLQDIDYMSESDRNILEDAKRWTHKYYKALKAIA